jgi:hypothetical protein
MAVGAIHSDVRAIQGIDGVPLPLLKGSAKASEFANLLSALTQRDGPDIAPVSMMFDAQGGPMLKIETDRVVTVMGHMRTTITSFADGTTETQTVLTDDPRPRLSAVPAVNVFRTFDSVIDGNSDLEPEIGLGARGPEANTDCTRQGKHLLPGLAAWRPAAPRKSSRPSAEDLTPMHSPDDASMGRMTDIVG